ncbi:hypothetical protein ACHAXR_008196 [Thalassiosira sp. AJA248-18]
MTSENMVSVIRSCHRRKNVCSGCHAGALLRCVILVVAALLPAFVEAYDTIEGHSCFRNLKGTMDSMFDLADEYPSLASVSDIGDSYLKSSNSNNNDYNLEGGFDIYAMNITASNGPHQSSAKGKVLITAGMHPREYAPPELVMRFAESLLGGYNVDPDITWLLHHTEVHLIFQVNPDGRYVTEKYQETLWRKNLNPRGGCSSDEIGVDINRNFDIMWGDKDGSSSNPCSSTYHGRYPVSEPETQAVVNYAKDLFPEEQRRDNPEAKMDVPYGEDIKGLYLDVHSPGGYIFFPWGFEDLASPDDDALQALARKFSSFNGYKLWAGGQPDMQYLAAGDSSDYMYGALGVASFGLELGEEFYEDCDLFDNEVVPNNLPVLLYAAMTAKKPFSLAKGPDIITGPEIMQQNVQDGTIRVEVVASDSLLVNSINGYPDFKTGDQGVNKVRLYLDVHPDDYKEGDMAWEMQFVAVNSDEHMFELEVISPKSGPITLYAQAEDSDGYLGPVSSAFFDVEKKETATPSKAPTANPSTEQPTISPSNAPTKSITDAPSPSPTTVQPSASPSVNPTTKPSTSPIESPTISPSNAPTKSITDAPYSSPTTVQPSASLSVNPTTKPSTSPTGSPTSSSPTSSAPTLDPTGQPTTSPSKAPITFNPTSQPTNENAPVPQPGQATMDPISNAALAPTSKPIETTLPSPTENSSISACSSAIVVVASTLLSVYLAIKQ